MSRFKIIAFKTILERSAVVAVILLSMLGIAVSLNWTFVRRLLSYPDDSITNVDWYEPKEVVQGKPSKLPEAKPSLLDRPSLEKVSAYAEANNSSALLVMHRGDLVWERYWGEFDATSTSNSMSMSKTILALLVGIAVAEEDMESEFEPVANYIPEWSQDERSKITLEDLLQMQSGLKNSDNTENPLSDLVQMYASVDADRVALNIPAVRPPQAAFEYNSGNSQILGEVLERATGERYVDYLSSRLWQPLQASDAYLWLDRPQGNPKPFCCLFATPKDWARVGQLFLDRGKVNGKQIVDPAWLDKMIRPSSLASNYGYHIWLKARTKKEPGVYDRSSSRPFLARDTFYLDGASRQRVYIIPAHDLVIVRIGEKPEQWDDSVIPNTLVESLQRSDNKINER